MTGNRSKLLLLLALAAPATLLAIGQRRYVDSKPVCGGFSLVRGKTESARAILAKTGGAGLVLSLGGGASPGMPRENPIALVEALRDARVANA